AINKTTGEETLAKQLDISVPPYWYQTLWFRMLVITIIGGLVYLFYRWRLMENEKRVMLTQAYEKKLLKREIDNIRSQMNPHFMFNALNSIKRYVVENQPEIASDYISKFSRLMRLILENSKHEYVTMENELEALTLYLMMEESRFGNNFNYEIVVDAGNEQVEELLIPPLIIQPYVENAIWHGLQQKDGNKKLDIYIKLEDNKEFLSIIVQDNGIGRKKSMELKSKSSTKKKSFGMEATLMRLKFYNEQNDVTVIDLYDTKGASEGTKVSLRFLTIHP
ncbi:MAG: histidine kinase, partial [Saprospiraceae bacterium]